MIYNAARNLASATGYVNGYLLASNIPMTVGASAAGAIGSLPAGLTAITHMGLLFLEKKGVIAEGRAKMLTPFVAVAFAAITFAALVALGLTNPVGALLIVLPTLVIGAILTYYCPEANPEKKAQQLLEKKKLNALNDLTKVNVEMLTEVTDYVCDMERRKRELETLESSLPVAELKATVHDNAQRLGTQAEAIRKQLVTFDKQKISFDDVAYYQDDLNNLVSLLQESEKDQNEMRDNFVQQVVRLAKAEASAAAA